MVCNLLDNYPQTVSRYQPDYQFFFLDRWFYHQTSSNFRGNQSTWCHCCFTNSSPHPSLSHKSFIFLRLLTHKVLVWTAGLWMILRYWGIIINTFFWMTWCIQKLLLVFQHLCISQHFVGYNFQPWMAALAFYPIGFTSIKILVLVGDMVLNWIVPFGCVTIAYHFY